MYAVQAILLILGSLGLNYGFLWKQPWLAVGAGIVLALAIWIQKELT